MIQPGSVTNLDLLKCDKCLGHILSVAESVYQNLDYQYNFTSFYWQVDVFYYL